MSVVELPDEVKTKAYALVGELTVRLIGVYSAPDDKVARAKKVIDEVMSKAVDDMLPLRGIIPVVATVITRGVSVKK